MGIKGRILDKLHRSAGSKRWLVALAIKLRNQAEAVVGKHLSDGIDSSTNGEERVLEALAPMCRTFVDVGANVGDWSARFLAKVPALDWGLLVEPNVDACDVLRKRFGELANVRVVGVAAGNRTGRASFYVEGRVGETSSTVPGVTAAVGAVRSVDVSTIDQILSERGIDAVDYLKIDAEGCDFFVLEGAATLVRTNRVKFVQFEYDASWALAGATLSAAMRFLDEAGYPPFLIKGEGIYKLDYGRYGEFFRYANFLAIRRDLLAGIGSLYRGEI